MTAQAIPNPLPIFPGADGQPLSSGYVYFGEANQDPEQYPVTVYWDQALTLVATQPLRTSAGYIHRNGAPAMVWLDGNCSIRVRDAQNRQVFYIPEYVTVASAAAEAAAAAAAPYVEDAEEARDEAQVAQAAAETARDQSYAASRVFASGAAGDASGSLSVNDYFYVISADSEEIYELWQKNGSGGSDTGKRVRSARSMDLLRDKIGTPGEYSVDAPAVGSTGAGTSAGAVGNIWMNPTALRAGEVQTLSVNIHTLGDGTGKFVIVRPGSPYEVIHAIPVTGIASTGVKTVDVSASGYATQEGDILGWHAATGGARVGFVAGSGGLFNATATVTAGYTFTPSASAATFSVQAVVGLMPGVIEDRLDAIEDVEQAAYTQTHTVGSTTPNTSDPSNSFNWTSQPMKEDGFVTSVAMRVSSAGTGELIFIGPDEGGGLTALGIYPVTLNSGVNTLDIGSDTALAMCPTLPSMLWLPAGTRLGYRRITGIGPRFDTVATSYDLLYFSGTPAVGDAITLADSGANGDMALRIDYLSKPTADFLFPSFRDTVTQAAASVAGMNVTVSGIVNVDGRPKYFKDTETITATASGVRYDTIYVDVSSVLATVSVVQGTERADDPTEFIPSLTASDQLPLFNVRATTSGVEVIPVWNFTDGEPRLMSEELERERRRGRLCLQTTLGKLRRGANVKVLYFGDSIATLQDSTPSSATPDGANRDRDFYYLENIGSDLVGTYPLYTAVQLGRADDGAGAVHMRLSFMWSLIDQMEKCGGTITYNNFGVGGTNTGSAVDGSLAQQPWLTAAIALAPDVVVINFGMNETNAETCESRMVAVANHFRDAGIEVVIMGLPRKRSITSVTTVGLFQDINRGLHRAAVFTGSAFVPLYQIYADDYIGGVGCTAADTCSANAINHPGIREHLLIGDELVKLVMGGA